MKLYSYFIFLLTVFKLNATGFVKGTLIKKGESYSQIENFEMFNTIISFDLEGGAVNNIVNNVISYDSSAVIYITIKGNNIYYEETRDLLAASPDQLFYVPLKYKWVKAQNLSFNDIVWAAHGPVEVCSVEMSYEFVKFFKILLPKPATYCVSTLDVIVASSSY